MVGEGMSHSLSLKQVFQNLACSEQGLSEAEAKERLQRHGFNELKREKKTSKLKIFFSQFNSFIIYILLAATIISAVLGETIDAIVIFIIVILNGVFGFIQENKAEKAIEALKKMASLQATVIRDGRTIKIDSKDLVPGDIIVLETGVKIPADARIIEAINLQTLEGSLTGESTPVRKEETVVKEKTPLGDRINMLFSGTIITNGRGKAVVTETGMKTEIGKIAHFIESAKTDITPLQKKIKSLGKVLGFLVLIICVIIFITGLARGGELLDMFLAAVSLAVAAIPEGLPVVITIALAIGVQKMVKRHALMRKLPSVETLGSTTVICTDKTGTLTKNEMTVKKIFIDNTTILASGTGYSPEGRLSENPKSDMIFRIGSLCNDAKLFFDEHKWNIAGDPTEACLLTAAKKAGLNTDELAARCPRIDEIQFDSKRKRMTTIHKVGSSRFAYMKGAPDVILGLCSYILINGKARKLTKQDRENIMKTNDEFSSEALRVLGFAYRDVSKLDMKSEQSRKNIEKDFIFVGLQGMIDPPRTEVRAAIERCKTAGIKVVMITGDYKGTAVAIAKELGIEGRAVEGSDLENIDLDKEIESIGVFARVNPEHKMMIVDALQKKGHIVAMTGDGVNDAPALKSADLGIAMGITGTDVAKEASAMILTDDNFSSIVDAVEEGRNIYLNIRKFVSYLLSCNMGEVLVLFIAMLVSFGGETTVLLPLIPVQILWVNLVTDGLPALALGVDPPHEKIMHQKPRNPKEHIISKGIAVDVIIIGLITAVATLFLFKIGLPDVMRARTLAMTMLVVIELFVAISIIRSEYDMESWRKELLSNKYLLLAIAGSIILQILLIYTPANKIFQIVPIGIMDWLLIAIVAVASYIVGRVLTAMVRSFVFRVKS
ncbi:MAG: calcium-translocating P-type ATPase, SERCA-type [Candidatus Woesearchaeota archaeon]